jgi:hypothetical protein
MVGDSPEALVNIVALKLQITGRSALRRVSADSRLDFRKSVGVGAK